MAIKKGDFIEISYTGTITEDNTVFDTTDEKVAKESNIYSEGAKYEPIIVCLGQRHVIEGLDEALTGREAGADFEVTIEPEKAFGQKNPKLIQLIATSKFKQQNMNPYPGMQVNIDGAMGTISRVSAGRTIVDFNHPLSGKELHYKISIKRVVTDVTEKINATLRVLGVEATPKVTADALALNTKTAVPKEVQENLTKAITDSVTEIKKVSYSTETTPEKKEKKTDNKI